MTIYNIQAPKNIHSKIQLPASKSISNRVLILNALSKSAFLPENLSDSDDTKVMLNAFESGLADINIGAAGTSMRFLTAYLSQKEGNWTITGTERMKNRPIRILVDALRQLGADINYLEKEGYPPLRICGKKLLGGSISLDGSVSSQYISALMMIAPYMENGLQLQLTGTVISQPYIRMTIRLMETFGVKTIWENNTILITPQTYQPTPFKIESDWSGASYWYEIMALCTEKSEIKLEGLEKNSTQGDSAVKQIFEKLHVQSLFEEDGVCLQSEDKRKEERLEYDFINEPDLAQTLVVTCCLLNIPFRFTGLQSLRIKETDRISALQMELQKLGYVVKDEANSIMMWDGEKCEAEPHPIIHTYEDHRMAMAFAPIALRVNNLKIREPEVVSKSYPHYWDNLKQVGFIITEE